MKLKSMKYLYNVPEIGIELSYKMEQKLMCQLALKCPQEKVTSKT